MAATATRGGGRPTGHRLLPRVAALLAVLVLVLALLVVHRARSTGPPAIPPSVADPEELVEGFRGELEGHDGSRLVARLVPLHADPGRQAFDARALARRLRLGEGEPWRLELRWLPEVDVDPDAARAGDRAVSAEAPMPQRWGLGLGDVRVLDAGGTALRPVAPPAGDAADPLRTVLAPPAEPLYPDEAIDLVLWGRAPSGRAELAGFLPEEAELRAQFKADTGLERPLVLVPGGLKRSDLRQAVARVGRASDVPATRLEGQAANLHAGPGDRER